MLGQPEQLSLPLFESDPDEGRPQSPRVENTKRRQRRRVIAGRSETPPADVSANDKPPAASAAPALLTTQKAADLLHVHPRTVQRLVERGEPADDVDGPAVATPDPLDAHAAATAAGRRTTDVADLTSRLKQRAAAKASSYVGVVRPSRAVRVS
jgi:hypothetical protein